MGKHLNKRKLTETAPFSTGYQESVEGWALKTVKKSSRMSEDFRNYLS